MKNLTKEQRVVRKLNYIKNLYEIALDDISESLINLCNINLDIELKDDINYLIKIDQEINTYKKAIKCVHERNKGWDDCKVMKTEYNIISCWENEKERLEYVQC